MRAWSRRRFLGAAAAAAAAPAAFAQDRPPNILFVSIDDLNDWAGLLGGHPQGATPHLDALAARGVNFTNAHTAAPLCNPSRAAVLTGVAPWRSGVYNNHQDWRAALPRIRSLPARLKDEGWHTFGVGKIFHIGDPDAWTEAVPDACSRPADAPGAEPVRTERPTGRIMWGPTRTDADGVLSDARVADAAAAFLARPPKEPFFLGCGFFKPHLPWFLPESRLSALDLDAIVLPTVRADDLDDVPAAGRALARPQVHARLVASGQWKDAVRAYLACLQFVDAQLGRVLHALEASPAAGRTVVVVWSDHGWSLGEKSHWKKSALWEECTRVPLVFAGPGVPAAVRHGAPVSLLDIRPTLLGLAGLPVAETADGVDLRPIWGDPQAGASRGVLTAHHHGNLAVRTAQHRLIRYADGSEELYDHATDPNEWNNLVADPAVAPVRDGLRARLPAAIARPAPISDPACGGVNRGGHDDDDDDDDLKGNEDRIPPPRNGGRRSNNNDNDTRNDNDRNPGGRRAR